MKFCLRYFFWTLLIYLPSSVNAQRGQTGDKTFADRFPPDVISPISNTFLLVKNTVDHDIIVSVRDQYKKYLNHVYIRNNEEYLFTRLPISRIYLQYKSKEFYLIYKTQLLILGSAILLFFFMMHLWKVILC